MKSDDRLMESPIHTDFEFAKTSYCIAKEEMSKEMRVVTRQI